MLPTGIVRVVLDKALSNFTRVGVFGECTVEVALLEKHNSDVVPCSREVALPKAVVGVGFSKLFDDI